MPAVALPLPSSVPKRKRFARLRERLVKADISHLRVVYFASAQEVLATLSASSKTARTCPIDLDTGMRGRLRKLFFAWLSISQPGWNDGPDAGGVLDWDLRANAFTHKHIGYRLETFRTVLRG